MDIPYTELSEQALNAVLEEFATREGTEYGAREFTLEEKIARLRQQLEAGKIKLDFDPDSLTCNLVPVSEL